MKQTFQILGASLRIARTCLLFMALLCATELFGQPPSTNAPAATEAIYDEQHRLTPGDLIEVKIHQEDDLNARARVEPDGTLTLPLLGPLRVGGRSVSETRSIIRTALQKDYIYNPQVNVQVAEYAKRRFAVLGEVSRPGYYEMPQIGKITLIEAIATAGGYTGIADASKITVKRLVDGKQVALKLNAKSMAKESGSKMFELQPDDTVTVGQSIF